MIPIRILLCLILTLRVLADTIRVPEDLPTIQNALDALAESDTVLVASGIYAEALHAPPLSFWMIGPLGDSTEIGATVDPTIIGGSDTLACLSLPLGATPHFERLTFRNGAEMIEARPSNRPGGIVNSATQLSFKQCAFDSLFWGVLNTPGLQGAQLILDECQFRNCQNASIMIPNCALVANNCSFEAVGFNNVYAGSFTTMSACTLFGNSSGHLAAFFGDTISIHQCVFGPSGPTSYRMIEIGTSSARVTECEFRNLTLGSSALSLSLTCGPDSVVVQNCSFHDCVVQIGQGVAGVTAIYHELPSPCDENPTLRIEGNHFTNLLPNVESRSVQLSCQAELADNIFEAPDDEFYSVHWTAYAEALLRTNSFAQNSRGCRAEVYGDARENWWGHPSGPHHEQLNPSGLGADVSGTLDIAPWLIASPHSDAAEVSAPHDFALFHAFPNPFNPSVTIEYALTREQDVSIVIYDLLGREIEAVIDERQQIGVHQVTWNANGFSSGIYFAQLSSPHSNQPSMTTKLLLLK